MEIIECGLWGVLPEEVVSNDLVDFVEHKIKEGQAFNIKSVPEGINPATIREGVLGFYHGYGMAYMSNPESTRGLFGIDLDSKKLIYDHNNSPFFDQRDSIVYHTSNPIYIRESFREVLEDFNSNDYHIIEFNPRDVGDNLLRHKNFNEILTGSEIQIDDLFT